MTADRAAASPMLTVEDLHVYYGNIAALKGISLEVHPGEIVTLIGSNGAGKSTTLRTISGLLRSRRGEVTFEGRSLNGVAGHDIVGLGISQSPEGRRIFPKMSVQENLELGAFLRKDKAAIAADFDRVLELFPRLQERISQRAGTMSGGEQQMLAVGRALMLRPRLMLLDEPSFGLAPLIVAELFAILRQVNRETGVAMLIVEQNAALALDMAEHAYLLETGRIVMDAPAALIGTDESIREAYLGY